MSDCASYHPLYNLWKKMIHRCHHPYHHKYLDYGGRGIRVCAAWRADFWTFVADMPARPSLDHSIDRINTFGHYEPGNTRWATYSEQNRNRRDNPFETINGETRRVIEWADLFEIPHRKVMQRLYRGWGIQAALYMPPSVRKGSLERLCREAWPDYLDVYARP